MKLFRNSALSSGGGPIISPMASDGPIPIGGGSGPIPIGGGGGSNSTDGFGYVWDSLTGVMKELYWSKPTQYPSHRALEGYRPDDSTVYGATYYQMEADGQLYLSTLYTAPAGDSAGVVNVTDVYESFSYRLGTDMFTEGGWLVSCSRYSPRYLAVDYSISPPTVVTGSAAAWGRTEIQNGDVFPMIMENGPPRLMALYSGEDMQMQLLVSSPLDGTDLSIALNVIIPPGPEVDPNTITPDRTYELVTQTEALMRQTMEALGGIQQCAAFTVLNYGDEYGHSLRTFSGLRATFPADGAQVQGQYGEFMQPLDVIVFAADAGGVVTSKEYFTPPDGMAQGASALPDLNYTPPVVPPFWRGFLRTEETI